MKTKTVYVAKDGREFDCQDECHAYETSLAGVKSYLKNERKTLHRHQINYKRSYKGFVADMRANRLTYNSDKEEKFCLARMAEYQSLMKRNARKITFITEQLTDLINKDGWFYTRFKSGYYK